MYVGTRACCNIPMQIVDQRRINSYRSPILHDEKVASDVAASNRMGRVVLNRHVIVHDERLCVDAFHLSHPDCHAIALIVVGQREQSLRGIFLMGLVLGLKNVVWAVSTGGPISFWGLLLTFHDHSSRSLLSRMTILYVSFVFGIMIPQHNVCTGNGSVPLKSPYVRAPCQRANDVFAINSK